LAFQKDLAGKDKIYNSQARDIKMEKKLIFGALSILSFASILFFPSDSNDWIWFAFLGIIFAIGWYKSK